jgi:hypothetical protein
MGGTLFLINCSLYKSRHFLTWTAFPGLEDGWTDGISYKIEVATKRQYRFYGYHLPDKFQDKLWQAKNKVDILKLVETEFGITSGIR